MKFEKFAQENNLIQVGKDFNFRKTENLYITGPCIDCSYSKRGVLDDTFYCDCKESINWGDHVKDGCIHFERNK